MPIPDTVRLNAFGFYEVVNKPSAAELRDYYAQRYYQDNHATYQASYPPEELEQLDGRLRLKTWVLTRLRQPAHAAGAEVPGFELVETAPRGRFLDVGCGEGWALAFFHRLGWEVLGLDYSSFSVERFQPALRPHLRPGDLREELDKLRTEGRTFDVLWLDNVLEHVLDPAGLLRQCRALTAPGGVLVVEVPNDFSALQLHLLAAGHIDRPFWVALPDHLAYFNPTGLRNLAEATGWRIAKTLADQPIDLHLLNPATNYVRDRAAGPGAHRARLEQDNFLLRTAPLAAVAAYYEGLAGVGLGRNIVAFMQPV